MTSGVTFSAGVSDFVKKTEARLQAVFRESCQRLISDMQTPVAEGGNMPVDTGFLRASIRLNKTGFLAMSQDRPSDTAVYPYSNQVASLVIGGLTLGETLFTSYTANYARHQHYGSSGRQGRQWVTMAAQRWPQIVAQVCVELQSRVEGGGSVG